MKLQQTRECPAAAPETTDEMPFSSDTPGDTGSTLLSFFRERLRCACADLIGGILYYSGIIQLVVWIRRKVLKRGRLLIIVYHRVTRPCRGVADISISPQNFIEHLGYLLRRYRILSIDECLNYVHTRTYPERDSVLITLDDGYEDNYTNAFPELQKWGLPAAIFLTGDHIGKEQMLKEEQIREMAGHNITFGAHTMTHPLLSALDTVDIRREVWNAKTTIEKIINKPVRSFAYPFGSEGHFDRRAVAAVAHSGFNCAFTTIKDDVTVEHSLFELPRKVIADFSMPAFSAKIEGVFDVMYTLRRALHRAHTTVRR
ncbi:MAG: polysaccharide deacetylase family protein [Candidatus Omnitrophica bacterium]|nr:polysaccharide deacetylase family protein [Candidatus Omnitrophota bacterium]